MRWPPADAGRVEFTARNFKTVFAGREAARRRVRELGAIGGFPAGKGGCEIHKSCKFPEIDEIFLERANQTLCVGVPFRVA